LLAYSIYDKNKIAALLALSTCLLIEPGSERAGNSLSVVLQILKSGVQKKDDKNISITLAPEALDTKRGGEDNFHSAELMIAMASALDYDDKHKDLPTALKIKDKLEMLVSAAGIDANKKSGFFTGFYIPFFKAMKAGNFLETASYILHSSSGDAVTKKWLEENKAKVDEFNEWMSNYSWPKENHF